ncbi:MAG: hypothetical protein WC975_12285 [Phycisphaerae bacterium]
MYGVKALCFMTCILSFAPLGWGKEGIQLSSHPQLFLDNFLVSRMDNLKREIVTPVKNPANPLIVQDQPWEKRMLQIYGTVLFDTQLKKYRCWYLGCEDQGKVIDRPEGPVTVEYYQCYAESNDGIRWVKPMVGTGKFGPYEKHNVVVVGGSGFCVLKDPADPDPNKRYKGLGGNILGFSPDGVRWEIKPWKVVGKNDTSSCVVKWKGEYLAYVRNQGKWENGVMREVGLSVSKDFVNWTPKRTVFKTDQKDGYPWAQPYGMAVTPYGDQLIGIVWLIRLDQKQGNNKHGIIDETQLVVSRDGRTWNRVADRANFLKPTPSTWDKGGVWPGTTMFVKDDQVYIYYTGTQNRHGDKFNRPSIGLATLPVDRFVGLRPKDTNKEGILETVPFHFSGGDLIVNGDGDIRVEILDEKGTIIPGFERNKCRCAADGSTRHRITWEGGKTLKDVTGKSPIRLRFIVKKGTLFAFQFRNEGNK